MDPKIRRWAVVTSQLYNRYSYVGNNPLKFIDPIGEDLRIVYDFQVNLEPALQTLIARGIAQRFRNAGIKNVNSFLSPSLSRPKDVSPTDRTVILTFTTKELRDGRLGERPNRIAEPHKATISLAPVAAQKSENFINYAINVGAHEAGHASGALDLYNNDSAEPGTPFHPKPAEAGSIMESRLPVEVLLFDVREFSEEDSRLLIQALNPAENLP